MVGRPANFLALRVWEVNNSFTEWQIFGRNYNNSIVNPPDGKLVNLNSVNRSLKPIFLTVGRNPFRKKNTLFKITTFCCSCDNSSVQHWWRGWGWIPQRRFDCGWKCSPPICWKTRQLSSPQVSSWASLVTNTTGTVFKFLKSFQKKISIHNIKIYHSHCITVCRF